MVTTWFLSCRLLDIILLDRERQMNMYNIKIRCYQTLLALFLFIASPPAQANEGRELAQEIVGIHTGIVKLNELSRIASQVTYIESKALLSVQGKWKQEAGNWYFDVSPFFYNVWKLNERLGGEVISIERYLQRDKTLDEAERKDFETVIADVQKMLDDTSAFYDLLKDEKIDEANAFYNEHTRKSYEAIQNATYTLGLTLEGRIEKTGNKVRLLK